jgi:hypothetical protein
LAYGVTRSDAFGFVFLQGFLLLHRSARYQKAGQEAMLEREEFLDALKKEYGARESCDCPYYIWTAYSVNNLFCAEVLRSQARPSGF